MDSTGPLVRSFSYVTVIIWNIVFKRISRGLESKSRYVVTTWHERPSDHGIDLDRHKEIIHGDQGQRQSGTYLRRRGKGLHRDSGRQEDRDRMGPVRADAAAMRLRRARGVLQHLPSGPLPDQSIWGKAGEGHLRRPGLYDRGQEPHPPYRGRNRLTFGPWPPHRRHAAEGGGRERAGIFHQGREETEAGLGTAGDRLPGKVQGGTGEGRPDQGLRRLWTERESAPEFHHGHYHQAPRRSSGIARGHA